MTRADELIAAVESDLVAVLGAEDTVTLRALLELVAVGRTARPSV